MTHRPESAAFRREKPGSIYLRCGVPLAEVLCIGGVPPGIIIRISQVNPRSGFLVSGSHPAGPKTVLEPQNNVRPLRDLEQGLLALQG